MTFLTKLHKSAKSIAAASLCTFVVAAICEQEEVADAAASVFWTSVLAIAGTWATEEIQIATA